MAELRLISVRNQFLRDIHLHVPNRGAFAVVGPSGAGKTSLLRVIAGLAPHKGRILMDGDEVQTRPPNRRAIGFVSQDLHLFPHLTLEGNLLIAMRRTDSRRKMRRRRAYDLMELLRISDLAQRRADTLSGGEKQRAALARVLASAPRVLLLDEPFSKLDFRTARYLRSEFKSLQQRMGLTTIIVTHDIEEAGEMTDALAVMHAGSLETIGGADSEPRAVAEHSDRFLDTPNLIPCSFKAKLAYGLIELNWAGGTILFPDENRPLPRLAVRRRDIAIGSKPPPGPVVNRFVGLVRNVEPYDDSVRVALDVNGLLLRAEMPHHRWEKTGLSAGQQAHGLLRMNVLETAE